MIGLSVLVWLGSRSFPTLPEGYPGPALFPRVIAVLLLLSGIGLVIDSLRGEAQGSQVGPFWGGAARFACVLGAVAGFIFLVPVVGGGLAAGMGCLALAAILRVQWKQAVVASVIVGLGVHLMFTELIGLS